MIKHSRQVHRNGYAANSQPIPSIIIRDIIETGVWYNLHQVHICALWYLVKTIKRIYDDHNKTYL